MIKIELSNASNGVIKRVVESHNAQTSVEILKVYEIEPETNPYYFSGIIKLLEDITLDLGLDVGSDFSPIQIKIDIDWGEKYQPSIAEIDDRIKKLSSDIKILKDLKKLEITDADNV